MLSVEESREELRAAGRYMMQHDLAWGTAGNISARTAIDRCLITASGTHLGELEPDDVVECSFSGEVVSSHSRRPSKEMPMHRAVYETRPEVNAVLHAAPFYSTLLACSELDVPSQLFVESMYYLERIERVPYRHPGSGALGEAVRIKATAANVLLLENHGVLVYDVNVREARMALQTLEAVCKMVITARAAAINLCTLPSATTQDFLERSGYKPRREWRQ